MKRIFVYIFLSLIVLALVFLSCVFGSVDISGGKAEDLFIIYKLRLPRAIMCILAGAGLAVCGAAYQAVFCNPLSDPYILGVSSGASLGAALAIVFGLDVFLLGVPVMAFVFAMLTVFLIMKLAQIGNRMHITTLLLAGISINFLFAALLSIIMYIDRQDMDKIYFWTMGSFAGTKFADVGTVACFVIVGISVLTCYAKRMNILLLGDMSAQSVGVNVEKTKKTILLVATLLTASVVSYCGVIGFVGLVVPHIIRLLVGQDNRRILPLSIFGGMIFMLVSDLMARLLASTGEMPIGSITSMIGAPFFIYLLYNAKKNLHF